MTSPRARQSPDRLGNCPIFIAVPRPLPAAKLTHPRNQRHPARQTNVRKPKTCVSVEDFTTPCQFFVWRAVGAAGGSGKRSTSAPFLAARHLFVWRAVRISAFSANWPDSLSFPTQRLRWGPPPPNDPGKNQTPSFFSKNSTPSANSNWLAEGGGVVKSIRHSRFFGLPPIAWHGGKPSYSRLRRKREYWAPKAQKEIPRPACKPGFVPR
jgi:hypothetical protein